MKCPTCKTPYKNRFWLFPIKKCVSRSCPDYYVDNMGVDGVEGFIKLTDKKSPKWLANEKILSKFYDNLVDSSGEVEWPTAGGISAEDIPKGTLVYKHNDDPAVGVVVDVDEGGEWVNIFGKDIYKKMNQAFQEGIDEGHKLPDCDYEPQLGPTGMTGPAGAITGPTGATGPVADNPTEEARVLGMRVEDKARELGISPGQLKQIKEWYINRKAK